MYFISRSMVFLCMFLCFIAFLMFSCEYLPLDTETEACFPGDFTSVLMHFISHSIVFICFSMDSTEILGIFSKGNSKSYKSNALRTSEPSNLIKIKSG